MQKMVLTSPMNSSVSMPPSPVVIPTLQMQMGICVTLGLRPLVIWSIVVAGRLGRSWLSMSFPVYIYLYVKTEWPFCSRVAAVLGVYFSQLSSSRNDWQDYIISREYKRKGWVGRPRGVHCTWGLSFKTKLKTKPPNPNLRIIDTSDENSESLADGYQTVTLFLSPYISPVLSTSFNRINSF